MTFNKLKSIRHDKKGISLLNGMILSILIVGALLFISTIYSIPYLSEFTDDLVDNVTNEEPPATILFDVQLLDSTGNEVIGAPIINDMDYAIDIGTISQYTFKVSTNAPRIIFGTPYQLLVYFYPDSDTSVEDEKFVLMYDIDIDAGDGNKIYNFPLHTMCSETAIAHVYNNYRFYLYNPDGIIHLQQIITVTVNAY